MSARTSAFPPRWTVTPGTGTALEGHEDGMKLRDWFAGLALAGRMTEPLNGDTFYDVAEEAYAMADAMMKARET